MNIIQKINKKQSKKGFTLVELVIVIAILAILAAVAIPVVTSIVKTANDNTFISNAQTMDIAVKEAAAGLNSDMENYKTTYGISSTKTIGSVTVAEILKENGLPFDDNNYFVSKGNKDLKAVVSSLGGITTSSESDATAITTTTTLSDLNLAS